MEKILTMKAGKMSKFGKIAIAVIFAVFFGLLYMQFRLVGVQYDDYGYFSLNYGLDGAHVGTKYSLAEMFAFLGNHYVGANGRLLYDGLMLTIFKIGGLGLIKFSAALIVTTIWILLYKAALHGTDIQSHYRIAGAGILCICYGGIHYLLHQHGTYWYAAFFTYYTPIIFTLLLVILYDKWQDSLKWYRVITLSFLCFISAWSFENWAVAIVVLMVALTIIYIFRHRRFCIGHIFMIAAALAGLVILLKSPGIRTRAGDRAWGLMSFEEYEKNIVRVIFYFFSELNSRYVFYLLTACLVLALTLFVKRKKVVDLICAIAIAAIEATLLVNYYSVQLLLVGNRLRTWLTLIVLFAAILTPVCRYYHFEQDKKRVMILFTAFISVGVLAAVPEIQTRVFIPFEVCSFLLVYDACKELYEGLKKNSTLTIKPVVRGVGIAFAAAYLLAICTYSSGNYIKTYRGYSENAVIYRENEAAIIKARDNYAGGEAPVITLHKNADDRYASVMLYDQEWFRYFISRYYGLPDDTIYIFD